MIILWGYLGCINLLALILYAVDKARARKKLWRIPERTLLLTALLGGSAGAIVGMYAFCHKTKHWKFRILNPLFLLLNAALIAVAMTALR